MGAEDDDWTLGDVFDVQHSDISAVRGVLFAVGDSGMWAGGEVVSEQEQVRWVDGESHREDSLWGEGVY